MARQTKPGQTIGNMLSRYGAAAFICAAAIYSQLAWASENHQYDDIGLRLAFALAAGLVMAAVFQRAVRAAAGRFGDSPDAVVNDICLAMWPGLLILLGAADPVYLWLAPVLCLALFISIRLDRHFGFPWPRIFKKIGFTALLILVGVAMAALAGEVLLREAYLLGPDFDFTPPDLRPAKLIPLAGMAGGVRYHTSDIPRDPSATRILLLGDSITHGAGINDAEELYVNRLEKMLKQSGGSYDLNVVCQCGREIDDHLKQLRLHGPRYKPDIIVYQWYCNDVTIGKHGMPWPKKTWIEEMPGDAWLMDHSYLWYFLAHRFRSMGHRPFVEYLLSDYQPGSDNWTRFNLCFREFLGEATSLAKRVIVVMYPAMPSTSVSKDKYSLLPLEERVKAAARADYVLLPGKYFPKMLGRDMEDPGAESGWTRYEPKGPDSRGYLIFGPYAPLSRGDYRVGFRLKASDITQGALVRIEAVGNKGKTVLASREIRGSDFKAPGKYQDFDLHFQTADDSIEDAEFRVLDYGAADIWVDCLKLHWPLEGQVEFVDIIDDLQGKRTWVTPFDGHPNAMAHAMVANSLAKVILQGTIAAARKKQP